MHTVRLGADYAIGRQSAWSGRAGSGTVFGRRPWRLSAKLLIASSIATVIGFTAICTSVMLDMRRGEQELARQTLENLAAGIDADISRNIELYDLSLRAVASSLAMPQIKGVSREIQHLILFDHAATAKHFGVIQVFDAQGRLTHDAASSRSAAGELRRRGVFPVHRADPDLGLYMSRPTPRRGAYSIVLSRRITDADGGFLGVVVGSIMLVLILFVVGTTLFLAREIGRRAEAEDRLEEMATTDSLTGLKNRRKFIPKSIRSWWAARTGPVAVLMIDADHFKAYNDTYGHQAGDQVLVGIAICISDAVRRSGDCPARYGGEEFAVLLPGLSAVEAFTVAETIRLKVEQWAGDPASRPSASAWRA